MTLRHIQIETQAPASGATASALAAALQALREELGADREFSAAEVDEAAEARRRGPRSEGRPRRDARDLPLVTIDPAGSRDLDQAVGLERRGTTIALYYAIADVAAFVTPDGPLDRGSRERGVTLYCPDTRLPLYPAALSEGAGSLLPGRDRPALLWTFELERDGACRFARIERAWVRSRAAHAYANAQAVFDGGQSDEALHPLLTLLGEVGRARQQVEVRRGGVSLPISSQSARLRDGRVELEYEQNRPIEGWNAQVSLLTGMQAARLMQGAGRGLLRTLPPADDETLSELRWAARSLEIAWPRAMEYAAFVRTLDPALPSHAAMIAQCTKAFRGAGYLVLSPATPRDERARHSALASPYAHVTAPLRRLADRYANEVVLALFEGREPPAWALEAIEGMPETMGAASRRANELERAAIDLIEAAVLAPHIGDEFRALVVRSRPRRSILQLREPAVRAPVGRELPLGEEVAVRLVEANLEKRKVHFETR